MIQSISENIASKIARNLSKSQQDKQVLAYGLQIIIGSLVETICILVCALVLGIFKYTIVATITFSSFRRIAGGTHCNTYNKCFAMTLVSMITFGFVCKYYTLRHLGNTFLLSIVALFGVYVIIKYVPGDTEKKRIRNVILRKRIKLESMALLSIWLVLMIICIHTNLSDLILPSVLGVSYAFLLILPVSYKVIEKL